MRAFALLIAFAVVLAVVQAAPEPGKEHCQEESLNIVVPRGEVGYPEGKCVAVRCSEEGETRVVPCEFAIGPDCEMVEGDLTKQYPACCPTVKCKGDVE